MNFLEGFFQEKKTLMYVSRGVGTSFLPFRLGVKPEITFFTFSNGAGSSPDSIKITNSPSKSIFAGISLPSILDLFDFYPLSSLSKVFDSRGLASYASINLKPNAYDLSLKSDVFLDFESDSELNGLNWQCGKWFERSQEHATSGEYSLRVELPPGQYPGIRFNGIKKDWSENKYLKMDVFNPSKEQLVFHIRIDDLKSGWDYAKRFDYNFALKPGMNHLSLSTDSIKTNAGQRPLELKNIERFMVFIPNNRQRIELFLDNIRLE